jgi:hypothetical protein
MELEEITNKQHEEIIQAIKEGRLYDYIACNYWRLENDTIIQLLKECIYLLNLDKEIDENIDTNKQKELIENLKDFQGWE